MKLKDYLQAIETGVEVITEIEIDEAQLSAGTPVNLNLNLQVGTKDGKPVRLTGGTLTEG